MKVTINGLTDSTIAFNTIGIILRGNSAKQDLYPNSVARHIDIKNDDQMRELICLKNARLISFVDESEIKPLPTQPINNITSASNIPVKPIQSVQYRSTKPIVVTEDISVVKTEDIEDMPSKQYSEDIEDPEELLTVSSKKLPRKNKKSKKTDKAEKIKTIKRSKKFGIPPERNDQEGDSKIVVMTANGPMTGNAVNNMAGEINESEATRASIEALRQMEDEEQIPESLVDESKLDIQERMGGSVVVATGENSVTKVAMRNSILPEADAIKKRGIKFIDPNGDETGETNESELDESVKNIFIDNKDNSNSDNSDDGLIEC